MERLPLVYGQSTRSPRGDGTRAADGYTCPQKIDSDPQTYFAIGSFEQLFDMTAADFAPLYQRLQGLPELAADAHGRAS